MLVIATTGARFGEASALRWDDIDFDVGTLHIRRVHYHGKVDTTKTGEARLLPIEPELVEVLKAHRLELMRTQAPGSRAGGSSPRRPGR